MTHEIIFYPVSPNVILMMRHLTPVCQPQVKGRKLGFVTRYQPDTVSGSKPQTPGVVDQEETALLEALLCAFSPDIGRGLGILCSCLFLEIILPQPTGQ